MLTSYNRRLLKTSCTTRKRKIPNNPCNLINIYVILKASSNYKLCHVSSCDLVFCRCEVWILLLPSGLLSPCSCFVYFLYWGCSVAFWSSLQLCCAWWVFSLTVNTDGSFEMETKQFCFCYGFCLGWFGLTGLNCWNRRHGFFYAFFRPIITF